MSRRPKTPEDPGNIYPKPDPRWVYCPVWDLLVEVHEIIDDALGTLSKQSTASPSVDQATLLKIWEVRGKLDEAATLLDMELNIDQLPRKE